MQNPEIRTSSEKASSPKDRLEILRRLRNDWQEEIPDREVGSTDVQYGHLGWKVQNAWFQAIQNEIAILTDVHNVQWPEEMQRQIEEFDKLCEQKEHGKTTAENIEKGNQFLDAFIRYLEGLPD